MAENKYAKYSFSGMAPGEEEGIGMMIGNFDGSVFESSNEYTCQWIYQKPRNMHGWTEWDQVIHGPHTHKYHEILLHLGTDPENPMDLGAEVVFHMGPEMEEHVITKSTLVFIPANLVHGWWYIRKVTRPFILFRINQSEIHTEKSFPELVPEEIRERLLCIDQGYASLEKTVHWPAGVASNYGKK